MKHPNKVRLNTFISRFNKPQVDILFLLITTFLIYIYNLSSSVHGGDSGDFLSAAKVIGVPHPSGYPLYTMIGILFLRLPIAATDAWKMGLASVIFSSIAVAIYYQVVFLLTKSRFFSFVTSLTLAFTYPFWLYAEVVEVIALNNLFFIIILFLTIKYLQEKKPKFLYLLSFFSGLSLTNNQVIILLLLPVSLAILTIFIKGKKLPEFKTILKCIFLFILGLTPYIYIPIAASRNPPVNWGYAVNLENFLFLVTRKYYGWGIKELSEKIETGLFDIVSYKLKVYLNYWLLYIHNLVIPIIISGVFFLIKKRKYLITFLILFSYLLVGPFFFIYAGNYFTSLLVISMVEKFLATNFIILFLLLPFGVKFWQEMLSKLPIRRKFKEFFKIALNFTFLLIPLVSFLVNFNKLNLRDVRIGDNLALDTLSHLPKNSTIFLINDSLVFNSIYYQTSFNYRTDIRIPGPNSSFEENLIALGKDTQEIRDYKTKNKGILDKETFYSSIGALLKKGPVFIDKPFSMTDNVYGKITAIPFGILYKLEFEDNLPYSKERYIKEVLEAISNYHLEDFKKYKEVVSSNLALADLQALYSQRLMSVANYLYNQYKEPELARPLLSKAFEITPTENIYSSEIQNNSY